MARTALIVHLDIRPESFSEFLDLARVHTGLTVNRMSRVVYVLM